MMFGKSFMRFRHEPSGLEYNFDAMGAIRQVRLEPETSIKVAASENWVRSNRKHVESIRASGKPGEKEEFDWTYTSWYMGEVRRKSGTTAPSRRDSGGAKEMPYEKLRNTSEPVLHYAEVHFYEDELSDHGISQYGVKCRVMPTYWFCLARFWLRVDRSFFRVLETRLYHEYGSEEILREYTRKEGKWGEVCQRVTDMGDIKNPNKFSHVLDPICRTVDSILLE
ncbi:TIP41-like protein [Schistocerca gregaria]|uniref:TIP41-like protein n=1 Tax=Schistocerca gregaria TaxID=7010 RepID=UPI00211E46CF|nr:TIP41-like protein [Schistocerca gregaria]